MFVVKSIALLVLITVLVSCPGNEAASKLSPQARVVGGTVTTIDKHPYIVQLRKLDDDHFCGATLVAPRFVVTAAHCFGSLSYKDVYVVGGANTRTDPGVRRRIVRMGKHPEYRSEKLHSDVAVLKLDADMVGINIRPIPLCTKALSPGDFLQISGWGQTGTNDPMSHSLRTVRAPTIPLQTCRSTYGPYVQRNMICAYEPGSKDSCGGDSGGPAVYNGQLCGVVAFGRECASKVAAGAYTDVYAVRDFIETCMKNF